MYNTSMRNYKFIISGKVQGVYYRKNVKNNALDYGFSGYVKNMPDGSVEAGVTCEESELDNFINILKKGSKRSNVTDIKQLECSETFTHNFTIR